MDSSGAAVGTHDGAYAFTVGQRRGLHLDHPAADGRPRYVLSIEPVTRTVTVGPAEELEIRDITAQRPVWTGCAPLTEARACAVQLRAHGDGLPLPRPVRRRRPPDHPARARPRSGHRPDRRPLRRRHRPGQRHHHRHPRPGQLLTSLQTVSPLAPPSSSSRAMPAANYLNRVSGGRSARNGSAATAGRIAWP